MFQDMTKAELYKRRNKNKQSKMNNEIIDLDDNASDNDFNTSFIENLTSRLTKRSSIDNDVELIRANTKDTPVDEDVKLNFKDDVVPTIKPVYKTYAKCRTELDEYMYIDSEHRSAVDDILETNKKQTRSKSKKSKSPVPRKRRKIDKKSDVADKTDNETDQTTPARRSLRNSLKKQNSSAIETNQSPRHANARNSRRPNRNKQLNDNNDEVNNTRTNKSKKAPKESIENDKSKLRRTRKRNFEEMSTPLSEKSENGQASRSDERNVVKPKRTSTKLSIDVNPIQIVTRSMRRRLELSLSPSEVKMLNFDSARSTKSESIESKKSQRAKTKAKASSVRRPATKVKTPAKSAKKRRR